jgi:hypothetical protein
MAEEETAVLKIKITAPGTQSAIKAPFAPL